MNKKTITASGLVFLLILYVVVDYFLNPMEVEINNLSWKRNLNKINYSFTVENNTTHEREIEIYVVFESLRQSRTGGGVRIWDRENLLLKVKPGKKEIEGTLILPKTTVQHNGIVVVRILSNKSLEVTPLAGARTAPQL
jgi:hypothetical protein